MHDLINKFETSLTRDKVEKCKQVKIASYFEKEKQIFTIILIFFMFIGLFTQTCLLMISLFFSGLSGHSSTNPQNLAI